jgi:hypothetical protein
MARSCVCGSGAGSRVFFTSTQGLTDGAVTREGVVRRDVAENSMPWQAV